MELVDAASKHRAAVAQMPVTAAEAAHSGWSLGKPLGDDAVAHSGRNVAWAAHGRKLAAAAAVAHAAPVMGQPVRLAGICGSTGASRMQSTIVFHKS